jgi:hypothetical protein
MNIEDMPKLNGFRYETSSGFVIEMPNSVLPVYDAENASVNWYDLELSSLDEHYSSPHLEQMFRQWYLDDGARTIIRSVVEDWGSGDEVKRRWLSLTSSRYLDPIPDSTYFCVGNIVEDRIEFSRRCLGKFVNQIIGHNPGQCVLMAGAEYLISASERETTEGTARDHTSHFEFVTLSREHSSPDLFSTAIQKAKRFGWRKWFQLSLSNRAAISWPRFVDLVPLCPCFVGGSGATS